MPRAYTSLKVICFYPGMYCKQDVSPCLLLARTVLLAAETPGKAVVFYRIDGLFPLDNYLYLMNNKLEKTGAG